MDAETVATVASCHRYEALGERFRRLLLEAAADWDTRIGTGLDWEPVAEL